MAIARDFFIALSKNQLLNSSAKKWGLKLGASKVVAGTEINGMIESVKKLNQAGILATIDNLGEFVFSKEEATEATETRQGCLDFLRFSKVSLFQQWRPYHLVYTGTGYQH